MRHYIALVHKDPDSDFGVSFPDFPGCITAGSTIQEAMEMAKEALAGHIACMVEDGEAIPEPSDADAVIADPENRADGGVIVLVPAPEMSPPRSVRVNVMLPEPLLKRIDERAENRSRFLAQAAEKALAEG